MSEKQRILEMNSGAVKWRHWGPYLSERQWGSVREDYSPGGTAWGYFPHDHARSRAYRWGEDGIAGISDENQILCFAVAVWNGKDPILKERLFGLTGEEGNHGEDVKELYYYLDATPTHSYLKMLYKYPQREFPYSSLVAENHRRGKLDPEYELIDTGVFDDDRYFDVFVEYAKGSADDILIQITAANRGPEAAIIHLLPHLPTPFFPSPSQKGHLRHSLPSRLHSQVHQLHQALHRRTLSSKHCFFSLPSYFPLLAFLNVCSQLTSLHFTAKKYKTQITGNSSDLRWPDRQSQSRQKTQRLHCLCSHW